MQRMKEKGTSVDLLSSVLISNQPNCARSQWVCRPPQTLRGLSKIIYVNREPSTAVQCSNEPKKQNEKQKNACCKDLFVKLFDDDLHDHCLNLDNRRPVRLWSRVYGVMVRGLL